jgi:hypothetical protein
MDENEKIREVEVGEEFEYVKYADLKKDSTHPS